VDFQVQGPYRVWEHKHTFEPVNDGTLISDRVRYAIPYGPLGALAHVAFVRRDLRRIFDFRRDAVAAMLA
jgi:ligand-binding SRPBCC domain-containing protein